MSLRSFLALHIVMSTLCASAAPLQGGGASPVPDNVRLIWSDSPRTTQTIGWRTDCGVSEGRVEFARAGTELLSRPAPAPTTLTTNVGCIRLFSATLRDLEPATEYRYRVGDGAHWSPFYTFRTESAELLGFKFLVFGDSHERAPGYEVWRETAMAAFEQNPDARFVMSVGDMVYAGGDWEQWQSWLAACQEVIARIPNMPAIGDHEPRGVTSDDEYRRPETFVKLFPVPPNGPPGFLGEVYSFDYGPAHIAVLNSSFTYEFAGQAEREAMIRAQIAWLDADLSATTKPWKLVVYHDATYNLKPDRAGTLTKLNFVPIIDKHRVDVVFNGHEHGMARSFFLRDGVFVDSASQGTVYFISGRTGDNAKDDLGRKIWHPFFYDPQAQTCYLVVEVGRNRLSVTTRLRDGTVVDEFLIDREKPANSTPVVPFGAYQSIRFAAFGTLLQFGRSPERNESGECFVDVNALATSMSGSFDRSSMILSYDDGEIRLQLADDMFLDQSRTMVSLSGLTSIGFHCRFHEEMNLVMVERWRD